jgi:WD repeat-containing protein 70
MSKKSISFGKISLNFTKAKEDGTDEPSTTGFGTFGRTPIQEQREIEEIADDLESQHVHQVMGIKNFGKKAKNFNVEDMVLEAKKSAHESNKKKEKREPAKILEAQSSTPQETNNDDDDDDDDIIGPLPPNLSKSEEVIGPPVPENVSGDKEKDDSDEDSYDELSGSDDEELTLEKRIPYSYEVAYSFKYIFI